MIFYSFIYPLYFSLMQMTGGEPYIPMSQTSPEQSDPSLVGQLNESAMKTVAFIKDRTKVSLSDVYTNNIKESIDKADEKEKEAIQESMNKETIGSYKDRIAALTEKFKGDPVKLAVLSSLASDLADQEL